MADNIVIINCFETYEHRVKLLKRYFETQGHNVHVITSDWLHFHKAVRKDIPEGFEMIHVKPYHKNLSVQRLVSHYIFSKDAFVRIEALQPHLIWVLIPPNSLTRQVAIYKKKYPNTKLVIDCIDMWPESMPLAKLKEHFPFSVWRNLRDKYIQLADAIVTECNLYQFILRKKCSTSQMHTLYLARDIVPLEPTPCLSTDKIALCYLGSINNIIDIPCICDIIKKIDVPVDLHIIGDGERQQELTDAATAAGANVIYHGKIYDAEEKKKVFDQCHFGLNIMKDSVFVGLTMKSMDYFEFGLPLINNIKGDTWDHIEQLGLGFNYSVDTQFDTAKLQQIAQERIKVRDFFISTLSYDVFKQKVSEILQKIGFC